MLIMLRRHWSADSLLSTNTIKIMIIMKAWGKRMKIMIDISREFKRGF
jgi:hypothetical protein